MRTVIVLTGHANDAATSVEVDMTFNRTGKRETFNFKFPEELAKRNSIIDYVKRNYPGWVVNTISGNRDTKSVAHDVKKRFDSKAEAIAYAREQRAQGKTAKVLQRKQFIPGSSAGAYAGKIRNEPQYATEYLVQHDDELQEDYATERGYTARAAFPSGTPPKVSPLFVRKERAEEWLRNVLAEAARKGLPVVTSIRFETQDPVRWSNSMDGGEPLTVVHHPKDDGNHEDHDCDDDCECHDCLAASRRLSMT